MMQMLAAGGLEIFTDEKRLADENNPKGYYETDAVKQLARRNHWISDCAGKVLKVVAPLIPYLPQNAKYKVVFMERDLDEILSSQTVMLERMNKAKGDVESLSLANVYSRQSSFALSLLALFEYPVLRVNYRDVVGQSFDTAAQLAEFFETDFDVTAMAATVEPALYRQKNGN